MKVLVDVPWDSPAPHVEGEPLIKAQLMESLLADADGQEDLYLGEIAKAEAGETILDLYNHYIHLYLYPDQAVLEDMGDPELEEESAEGPPRCIRLSLVETKQLLLDWLAAKKLWRSQRAAATAESTLSPPGPAT